MKKLILMVAVSGLLAFSGYAQQETSVDDCINSYKTKITRGYNAVAAAEDGSFFVCGYANGLSLEKYAERQALGECEQRRKDPANEIKGIRKIMTHCRILET